MTIKKGIEALDLSAFSGEDQVVSGERVRSLGEQIHAARTLVGKTGKDLGQLVGLGKDQISKIERGVRKASIEEVYQIAEALNTSVDFLLGRVERPRLALAARLAPGTASNEIQPLRNRARQILEIDDLITRVTEVDTSTPSTEGALAIKALRTLALNVPGSPSEAKDQGKQGARLVREMLNLGVEGLTNLAFLFEKHFGVHVALAPWGEQVDGLCVHSGSTALLMASTDFTEGHVHFTLSHELAHHLFGDPKEIIDEHLAEIDSTDLAEVRAHAFAAHFLMPADGLLKSLEYLGEKSGAISGRCVIQLMEEFKVSLAPLIFQLNTIQWLSYASGQNLKKVGANVLVAQNQDVAPHDAFIRASRIRRVPDRLLRDAKTAAKNRQVGLGLVALLLEREDDEALWRDIFQPAEKESLDVR